MTGPATIFAPASAHGRAGVAIIRISGTATRQALAALGVSPLPAPRMATLATFTSGGRAIDRGLALWFPAPASFTGEDMAELHVHGSRAVIRAVCDALSQVEHLRFAEAGEFARRAFLNGKLDLAEVEGLADLIDAETESQRAQALRLAEGAMSSAFEQLRGRIVKALAHMEATIDFSDEDIPPALHAQVNAEVKHLKDEITRLLDDHRRGERIREGISIIILGAPNAGKSSLLNALAKRDAAIVSHTAGTTRDPIEVHLDIAGFACVLVDTAGLRESDDPIEREGIRRARARAANADLKLLLFDASELPAMDAATLVMADGTAISVFSKADLASTPPSSGLSVSVNDPPSITSLLTVLEARLHALLDTAEPPMITRARHREALLQASYHLGQFLQGGKIELCCEELRLAASYLGKITGKISVDELLDSIFKEFCIGK